MFSVQVSSHQHTHRHLHDHGVRVWWRAFRLHRQARKGKNDSAFVVSTEQIGSGSQSSPCFVFQLKENEARRFFQQIISGVAYCHRHMVRFTFLPLWGTFFRRLWSFFRAGCPSRSETGKFAAGFQVERQNRWLWCVFFPFLWIFFLFSKGKNLLSICFSCFSLKVCPTWWWMENFCAPVVDLPTMPLLKWFLESECPRCLSHCLPVLFFWFCIFFL